MTCENCGVRFSYHDGHECSAKLYDGVDNIDEKIEYYINKCTQLEQRNRVLVEALKNICSHFSDDSTYFSYTIAKQALKEAE